MDLNVLWQLSYGLYAVGVNDSSRPTGCIVNTLFQVTSENPILGLSMNRENYTYEVMERTGRFSVSILSEQTPPTVISRLGFSSGRSRDKFSGLEYDFVQELPILKENCCGTILCDILGKYEAETHFVILARVTDAFAGHEAPPMTYQYYHEVIKGKAPKSAPTYRV